nr:MAG TPA: hypothetical protein [Herelleviridae sp.]
MIRYYYYRFRYTYIISFNCHLVNNFFIVFDIIYIVLDYHIYVVYT